jgi:endonuclease YncB( thermonuclease family)
MMIVLDGDTIVSEGYRYRLVGLNAPEIRGACPREQQLAELARLRLQKIADGGAIIYRVACARGDLDRFGRRCARLITLDGVDAGEILIREGLAEPYRCGPWGCPKRKDWCHD